MNGWLVSIGAVVLVACSEVAPTPTEELVAEVRAWRRQQQAAANLPPTAAVDPAAPRALIAEALQPLREVLTELSGRQHELQERQVALTQELQRWSQLLVESVQGARNDESKAMAARLQQLEQSLREQDQRHRAVEDLMDRSLLRTAEQLEAFLRQVGGGESPAPGTAGGVDKGAMPDSATAAPRPGRRYGLDRWGWFLLVTMAAGAGWWFVHRARRRLPLAGAALMPVPPPGPAAGPAATAINPATLLGGLVPADASAPEIWAAAALLGEAVGRLRQTPLEAASVLTPALAPPVVAEPSAPAAVPPTETPLPDDEWFVIEGLGAGEPLPDAAAPARMGPRLLSCRLPAVDLARAAMEVPLVFATEPAVLTRPAPVVAAAAGGVEVTFALLPGTPAGERSRIEQRLREALR